MLGYGFLTAVLLASMYASHTLIAYPIISRYGLSRLHSVNITIGGTAITVTLALIILAVIGGMFKGTVDGLPRRRTGESGGSHDGGSYFHLFLLLNVNNVVNRCKIRTFYHIISILEILLHILSVPIL